MSFSFDNYMRRRILVLSWPVFVEMCGIMLSGILTTAMVGQYGAVSLAAVGLATMLQMAAAMVFAALGTGAAAIVARETGAKNWTELKRVTGQALAVGIMMGIVIGIGGWWYSDKIFIVVNADPDVAKLAGELLRITFLATPLHLIIAISNNILRGMGLTARSLLVTIINNAAALIIGYILIFGKVCEPLGAYGAAWGLAGGFICGSITALLVLTKEPLIRLRLVDVIKIDITVIKRILKISIPAALEQLALQGGRTAFTFMLATVGAVQFAAHEIALQVESLSFLPGFSFAVAAMTLVGQNLGSGMPHRAIRYVKLANQIGVWGMVIMGGVFVIYAEELTRLFINDSEVIYWGAACVVIAAIEQPTIALTLILGGALRGAGDTKSPMYITTIGVWLVRMPLIYLFIIVWHQPITAAWYITAGDFLVRSAILWYRFKSNKWLKAVA